MSLPDTGRRRSAGAARAPALVAVSLLTMCLAMVAAGASTDRREDGGTLRAGTGQAAVAQQQTDCGICHGDLELLRRQAPSMEEAQSGLVPQGVFETSAHGEMECVECHEGLGSYPHPDEVPEPASCASCHEESDTAWSAGAHANPRAEGGGARAVALEGVPGPGDTARCVDCHGIHDTDSVARLEREAGIRSMNARCVECHATVHMPEGTAHADTVACWSCHRPHDVRHVDTPESAVAPRLQPTTCGACHDSLTNVWTQDVHATALMDTAPGPEVDAEAGGDPDEEGPPACVDCHGSHDMVTPATHEAADTVMVQRCGSCHEDYLDTFLGTYHGKATAVGSRIAATCHDCHSAHEVHPASEPASWVSEERLTETCGECHGHVRPSFVAYQSHPDPTDREKNPVLFYSFWFMNSLLVGVLTVFGLHTLLWWVRLYLDKKKGIVHEIGGRHE